MYINLQSLPDSNIREGTKKLLSLCKFFENEFLFKKPICCMNIK